MREDYEKDKFAKANQNIYNMFLRAEKLVVSRFVTSVVRRVIRLDVEYLSMFEKE